MTGGTQTNIQIKPHHVMQVSSKKIKFFHILFLNSVFENHNT